MLLGSQGGRAVRGYWRLFDVTQVLVIEVFVYFPVVHNLAGMGPILRSSLCEFVETHHFLFMQCALPCCKRGSSSPDHSQATFAESIHKY